MPPSAFTNFLSTLRRVLRRSPTSNRTDKTVGNLGEQAAAAHLTAQGFQIIARNFFTRQGEIDLIAFDPTGKMLVIVEVKTSRKDSHYHQPEFVVDRKKQTQLIKLATQFARKHGYDQHPIRFDVIGVTLPEQGDPVIRHHPGAFGTGI